MVLDLRAMDDLIRLWLGAGDMDEDDRQALETVRDLISDLISRPGPTGRTAGLGLFGCETHDRARRFTWATRPPSRRARAHGGIRLTGEAALCAMTSWWRSR